MQKGIFVGDYFQNVFTAHVSRLRVGLLILVLSSRMVKSTCGVQGKMDDWVLAMNAITLCQR